jgi:phage tail-like protein
MAAIVSAMEDMHEPSEKVLSNLDSYFDPRRAPDAFVFVLARWTDIERFLRSERDITPRDSYPLTIPLGQLREWIASVTELARWRGTRRGLLLLLECATGINGYQLDEQPAGPDGKPRPFHFRLTAPAAAKPHAALIERILELEKPAYMTYDPVLFEMQ